MVCRHLNRASTHPLFAARAATVFKTTKPKKIASTSSANDDLLSRNVELASAVFSFLEIFFTTVNDKPRKLLVIRSGMAIAR